VVRWDRVRQGKARCGQAVKVRHGKARRGLARQLRRVSAGYGLAWSVRARQSRRGMVGCGPVRCGTSVRARCVTDGFGRVRRGRHGTASSGMGRLGWLGSHGKSGYSKVG
jgi:hypothetical protein